MMDPETFAEYDFDNIWKIIDGYTYPRLIREEWSDRERLQLDIVTDKNNLTIVQECCYPKTLLEDVSMNSANLKCNLNIMMI